MRYKKSIILLLIFLILTLTACNFLNKNPESNMDDSNLSHNHTYSGIWVYDENGHWQNATCKHTDLKGYFSVHTYDNFIVCDDNSIQYECSVCGYIKNEKQELLIDFKKGTNDCYYVNEDSIIFSGMKEDSVYSIKGQFFGNIVIEVCDELEFELEFNDFMLYSSKTNPITIKGGKKVTLQAKKETTNYVYDNREVVNDESEYKASIYSDSDLVISGKGMLYVFSSNNDGIHTKDDLKIKNVTLNVNCEDNALKGNDSVSIDGGTITLIAKTGDGIKTKNSDISSKGKQRGTVIIKECNLTIYAACDGIDAAYNVEISETATNLTIYTDKYSEYSKEVTDVSNNKYYIRYNNQNYKYSVKYYNSDDDYIWENATFYKSVNGNRGEKNYYYSFPKHTNYEKIKIFMYTSIQEQAQEIEYKSCTDYLTWNKAYDTIILTSRGYNWSNYTTTSSGFNGMGGPSGFGGGMQEGNPDKGDHSTKGIKASNEIIINDGIITIKSYDDGIHANNDTELENGETPKGNITISGGTISIYSDDDGIHADDTVNILGGKINVLHSYEGIEGNNVLISDGDISVISLDDGINGTATSGVAIEISGGMVYVYAGGDGLDSNSKTSYQGIVFSGGKTIIISTSKGNSSIDTERGYTYSGGSVLAIMPSNGMTNETTNCNNFSSIATKINKSLSKEDNVIVKDDFDVIIEVEMPCSLQAMILFLGSNKAIISVS